MSFSMKLPAAKSNKKQYGLILPASKKAAAAKPAFNAFEAAATSSKGVDAASTDSTTAEADAALRRRVGTDAARSVQLAQVARTHEEALAQDASVFDYDGVYDELDRSRQVKATQRKAQREAEKRAPKYIETLLAKAKIREIENERIRERRLLNERKADDALYGDKEKLISASYKRKLLEQEKWDAEDARLDAIEDAEDVTKRGGDALAGFYSNLLSKNIAMGGSTANARSAYTVRDKAKDAAGGGNSTERSVSSTDGRGRSAEDRNSSRSSQDRTREPSAKRAKRQRRDDDAPSDAALRGAVAQEPEPASAAPSVEGAPSVGATVEVASALAPAPVTSKDDVISAAKARFLARKAQREQQQQQQASAAANARSSGP